MTETLMPGPRKLTEADLPDLLNLVELRLKLGLVTKNIGGASGRIVDMEFPELQNEMEIRKLFERLSQMFTDKSGIRCRLWDSGNTIELEMSI